MIRVYEELNRGMQLSRRGFVAISAGLGALALPRVGLTAATPADLTFRIMRKDSEIGTHRVAFSPTAQGFDVDVTIELAVKMAFVTVYSYEQHGRDTWSA